MYKHIKFYSAHEIKKRIISDRIKSELCNICEDLELDFNDFKEAFVETKISYKDIKSFDRVLADGFPPAFFQNDEKCKKFLNAVDKAIENCVNGEHPLKRSNLERVKKAYGSMLSEEKMRAEKSWNKAKDELEALSKAYMEEYPEDYPEGSFKMFPQKEETSPFRHRLHPLIAEILRADPEAFAKEETTFQSLRNLQGAKYFWDDIWATIKGEEGGYKRVEDDSEYNDCYMIHATNCVQFVEMLERDPVIKKRLKEIFDEVDKVNPAKNVEKRAKIEAEKAKRENEKAKRDTTI